MLISRVKRGKIGPAEFEFEKEVEVLAERTFETERPPMITDRERAVAAADPNGAIIKIWLEIEFSARKVFHKFGVAYTGTPHTPFMACIKELEAKEVISFEEMMLIMELQILRNRAVHKSGFRPSAKSVEQYIEISKALIVKLDAVVKPRV